MCVLTTAWRVARPVFTALGVATVGFIAYDTWWVSRECRKQAARDRADLDVALATMLRDAR